MMTYRALSLIAALLLASATTWAQIKVPPPPGNVRVSEVTPVDALRGSFVVEWTPAFWPYTPRPTELRSYVLYNCEYETLPGGSLGVAPTGGQTLYTGPPYRLRAICSCKIRWPYTLTTEAPRHLDAYSGRSNGVFLIDRVPCATLDGR